MAHALSEAELLALIDALADGAWHSGEDLAARAGISRAALAKRVERLRDWQLEVEGRQGLGYRLAAPLQRLDRTQLQDAAGAGLRVDVLAHTDSTNARLLAADPAQDPQALFAEFQSAGRGRRGRDWQSPFGVNIYFSLAWSFASWPAQLATLPLAAGVACARALRTAGLPGIGIKWPNDLYFDGRKLGGILIEHRGETGGPCRVVIGIGINVAMSRAAGSAIRQDWTSVHEACVAQALPAVPRTRLAAALPQELGAALARFAQQGFDAFAADWAALDLTRDRPVRVHGADRDLDGIARGVDRDGALIVETLGEWQHVHAGDVSLRLA